MFSKGEAVRWPRSEVGGEEVICGRERNGGDFLFLVSKILCTLFEVSDCARLVEVMSLFLFLEVGTVRSTGSTLLVP